MPEFKSINSKVITAQVRPGQQVVSRRGAMIAYVGNVSFHPAQSSMGGGMGGGMGGMMGMAGRAMAGEHTSLMVGDGQGEVYYGFQGLEVTIVSMNGSQQLTCEASRLLAHDISLASSVVFLGQQGGIRGMVTGAVSGQGMFTTQFTGAGEVALLAHGGTIPLEVRPDRPLVVDPQAYVGHLGNITLNVQVNASWRDAVGRGSGEAIQLQATGQGTLYVQASEEKL